MAALVVAAACAGPAATPTRAPTAAPTGTPTAAPTTGATGTPAAATGTPAGTPTSAPTATPTTAPSVSGLSGNLTVLEWSGYEDPLYWADFQAANPDVVVNFPFGTSDADVYGKMKAGDESDLFHSYTGWLQFFVDEDLAQPIDTSRLTNWAKVPDSFKQVGQFNGEQWFVPWDWGFTSILYRTDKVPEGVDSWDALMNTAYKDHVSMWDDGPGAVTTSSYIHGYDETAITDEQLADIKQEWIDQKPLNYNYWTADQTELVPWMKDGSVWVAYAWQGAYATLLYDGVPVAYADPKEGRNSWVGAYGMRKDTTNLDLAYAFLDAKLGQLTGENLVTNFYYGTTNADVMNGITDETLKEAFSVDDPIGPRDNQFHAQPHRRAARRLDDDVGGSEVQPVAGSTAGQAAGRAVTDRPVKPARPPDSRRNVFRVLYSVPVITLLLFLVAPLFLMAALSLREDLTGPILAPWSPTVVQYQTIADSPSFLRLLGVSTVMAAIVSLTTTVLAYPLAYFLRFQAGGRAGLYLFLLLLPFWTSYLLRVFAWRLMLGPTGVVNSLLEGAGLINEPIDALLYNRTAVMVTLTYVWIPFSAIPILAALQRVDPSLHEAAADLYARPAGALPARHPTPEHARRSGGLLHLLHPDGRRVRDAAARRRHRRNDVRQHHPEPVHARRQLDPRLGAGDSHACRDAGPGGGGAARN